MARKYARRHSPEQIIGKLRDAEVDLASGLTVDEVCHQFLGGSPPGFRQAVIAPCPCPEQLQFAQLDYDSPVGRYHSGWRVTADGLTYELEVPPNATATFRLPLLGAKDAIISESGTVLWRNEKPAGKPDGIATPVQEHDRVVFGQGAGSYSFGVKGVRPAP